MPESILHNKLNNEQKRSISDYLVTAATK